MIKLVYKRKYRTYSEIYNIDLELSYGIPLSIALSMAKIMMPTCDYVHLVNTID